MKRLLCLTAVFALAAPVVAQSADETQGYAVYLRTGYAATAEAAGFVEQLSRALDKSRYLRPVPVADPAMPTIELEAPLTFEKTADGVVNMTYEMSPARGNAAGRTYKTNCKLTQLERCADEIVRRVERYGREMEAAERPQGLPSGF